MPVLIDTFDQQSSDVSFKNEWRPSYTEKHGSSLTREFKSGTGSRRKPLIPDQTPYEYRSVQTRAPIGHGKWIAGSQFTEFSGVLPMFLTSTFNEGLQTPLGFDPDHKKPRTY